MLNRVKSAGLRVLREVASLPLKSLGNGERGRALEKLIGSMVSELALPEGPLRFMTSTPSLQARASSILSKEPDTIQWIDCFNPDDVFWDVGANVGIFGLYAARRRRVEVLAFEPSADNYMVLCRNIEINALERRVVPYCIAFAANTELGVLNSPSREQGAALHQFGRRGQTSRYWDGDTNICAQGMIGFSIDDFIRQFQPSFPTRMKIDVDGIEWSILQGATQTIRDPRLQSIMAELIISDETERERAISFLSDAGFDLVSWGDLQAAGGEAGANHFFARTRAST
jgi:FkbM family methyltransferase